MITFIMLLVLLLVLLFVAAIVLIAGGASIIAVLGDLIVCMLIVWSLVKLFRFIRRRK